MKQVLQTRSGVTVVRDVPAPICQPGGVLVRNAFSVISSGTEGARVALSQKSLLAKARERPDLVREVIDRAKTDGLGATRAAVQRQLTMETAAGYSSAGTIVEVGAHASGLDVGDRVACCGGGHANHAEVVAMPRNLVARVPDGVPMEAAAFSTVAAIALHAIRLAEVEIGERVAVLGCGLIGQITCRLLSCAGAEVFALDISSAKVAAAREGGADHAIVVDEGAHERVLAAARGIGVDSVIVTAASTSSEPLLLAGQIARDRGKIVLVGAVPIEFSRAPLYDKELSFRVSRSYGPGRYDLEYEERGLDYPLAYVRWTEQRNLESVLDLLARGRLTLVDLIEEIVPIQDASRAYERLVGPAADRPVGAIVLNYSIPEPSPAAGSVATSVTEPLEGAIRLGLVGPGSFASRILVPAFVAAGAELELVAGGAGPSAEAATRELGFRRLAERPEAVLSDRGVNVVVVGTRHATHAELAAGALDGGKSVFCEKPLALDREELTRVMAAARASRGILAVGFNRRFAPMVAELKTHLAASTTPATASYRVSAGHIDGSHWVHDLEQGGGRILGEVCHFVDTLRFLVGDTIVEVNAVAHGDPARPIQARDNVVATLRFAGGSIATLLYAAEGGSGVPKERLEIFRGSRTGILEDFRTLELFGPGRSTRRRAKTQDKGHRAEVAAFVAGVRAGAHPVDLAEVEEVSLATIALVESLKHGAPIRLA